MKHHKVKKQDEKVTENDIEALEPFLGATACSSGTITNELDLRKYFAIIVLAVLTISQSLLIVWSKKAGKYEHSVRTADFLAEALKCVLSLVALFKIWRSDGITQDNMLSMSFDEVSVYSIPAALYFIKNLLQCSIFAYMDTQTYQILRNFDIISTGVFYCLIVRKCWRAEGEIVCEKPNAAKAHEDTSGDGGEDVVFDMNDDDLLDE